MNTKPIRVIESPGSPSENDLWLNGTTLRKFHNGEWVEISGGGGGGDDSGSGSSSVMFVEGRDYEGYFSPLDTSPSWQDVADHYSAGGTVICKFYGIDGDYMDTVIRIEPLTKLDILYNSIYFGYSYWEKPTEQ